MKIEIVEKKRNELLKRDEVEFHVDHEKSGTPKRLEVKQKLASVLGVDETRVFIKKLVTKTGSMTSIGQANVYDSADQAKLIEQKHIILRNSPKNEKKE
ncbi:MAG: 30S ribosomal protein S24e [Candidatus Bathyarchaeia archaeon]|nr:30S ribosomal protein S24e [Candidatus Bathyarchaeota archaeon]